MDPGYFGTITATTTSPFFTTNVQLCTSQTGCDVDTAMTCTTGADKTRLQCTTLLAGYWVDPDGMVRTIFKPADKAALQTAVDAWCSNEAGATATYGPIESWDTSLITSLRRLLDSKSACNPPIGDWDVSQVTDML